MCAGCNRDTVYCESWIAPLLDELKYNINLRMHYIGEKQVWRRLEQAWLGMARLALPAAAVLAGAVHVYIHMCGASRLSLPLVSSHRVCAFCYLPASFST